MLHVAFAGRGVDRAGAEEQQALEQRVIEDVKERGGESERRGERHAVRLERQREPEPDEDDADILDRVIGEQPLEIVLHQRVENAHHRGDAAERKHENAPPPRRRAGEVEHDAHETVDRDLGHHAAHQRGDMARRRRMGERQPGVQRHDAGLRSGADQRQNQNQRARRRGRRRCAHLGKGIGAVGAGEQAEAEQQRHRAEARHHQIDVAGAQIVGLAMMRHHQRPRGERHELPGHQKREGVVGEQGQRHAGEEGGIERQHALRRRLVLAIAQREQTRAQRAEIGHDQKERRQRVEAEMHAEPGNAERQCDLLRGGSKQLRRRGNERDGRDDEASAVNDARRGRRFSDRHGERGEDEQRGGAAEGDIERHGVDPWSPWGATP